MDAFVQSPEYRVQLPAEFLPAKVGFLAQPLPCDVEMLSLRPMPILDENASDADKLMPSKNASALLILNRYDLRLICLLSLSLLGLLHSLIFICVNEGEQQSKFTLELWFSLGSREREKSE